MPQTIEYIDAIARRIKRDVMFVIFHSPSESSNLEKISNYLNDIEFNWRSCQTRTDLIAWLDSNGIGWTPCGHVGNPKIMAGYRGQIYIDLPYDVASPVYQALDKYLELPDGQSRFQDATFCVLGLGVAMKNAAHDEPGFWEKQANDF